MNCECVTSCTSWLKPCVSLDIELSGLKPGLTKDKQLIVSSTDEDRTWCIFHPKQICIQCSFTDDLFYNKWGANNKKIDYWCQTVASKLKKIHILWKKLEYWSLILWIVILLEIWWDIFIHLSTYSNKI